MSPSVPPAGDVSVIEGPGSGRRAARAPAGPQRASVRREWWIHVLAVAVLIGVWEACARLFFNEIFFPPATTVARAAADMAVDGSLFTNSAVSLQRILLGFLIGSALGAPIGLAMGAFRPVRAFLDVYVEFFRFIPSIAWLTPAIIWFGIGETSKVFIIIYTTIFVVVINTAVGVTSIPINKLRAARSLGASSRQSFGLVVLPATVPYILTGMRIAMANSFTTVVAAEMIAADSGLGYMIWNARTYFETDVIFVSMVVLGVLGLLTDRMFRVLIARFAARFHAEG